MGSFNRQRVFDPLDLEIIDQVYRAVWAQVEAREPFRDTQNDRERQEAIRKRIFAFAGCGKIDFDTLCDIVIASMPETWLVVPKPPTRTKRRVTSGPRAHR